MQGWSCALGKESRKDAERQVSCGPSASTSALAPLFPQSWVLGHAGRCSVLWSSSWKPPFPFVLQDHTRSSLCPAFLPVGARRAGPGGPCTSHGRAVCPDALPPRSPALEMGCTGPAACRAGTSCPGIPGGLDGAEKHPDGVSCHSTLVL